LLGSDASAGDQFGYSVAVSGDTAIIGAAVKNSNTGAAYVFTRSGATWAEQQELTASDGAANDKFGYSVAVSGDTAVIGAPGNNSAAGAAYVFTRSGTTWTEQPKLTASDGAALDNFGASVAVSGDAAIVGASEKNAETGGAYIFTRSGT